MIESRRMRWEEQITHTGKKRNVYRILVEKPEDSVESCKYYPYPKTWEAT
jgi:hypothetical protein